MKPFLREHWVEIAIELWRMERKLHNPNYERAMWRALMLAAGMPA